MYQSSTTNSKNCIKNRNILFNVSCFGMWMGFQFGFQNAAVEPEPSSLNYNPATFKFSVLKNLLKIKYSF